MKKSTTTAEAPIIPVRYSVQRQPRWLCTIKPLTVDANSGPVKTVIVKRVIAKPRMRLSKMSEKTGSNHGN